jgi:CheY-like chemotaxis protein
MRFHVSIASDSTDVSTAPHLGDNDEYVSSDDVAAATILLVDDDPDALAVFRRALEYAGFTVLACAKGQAASDLLRQSPVNLVVVELDRPDISGVDLVRRTVADGNLRPFILVSGFLTVEVGVEGMRLEATDVLEKAVIERLPEDVQASANAPADDDRTSNGQCGAIHLPHVEGHPGSAAHRWAVYVIKACEAEGDLRTLEDWARSAGVGYSTLRESCRIVRIPPQAGRDFTRALRAMIKSSAYRCDPSVLLDVSDRRTLKVLLERAGPFFRWGGNTSILQFIRYQRFVPTSNEALRVLLGYFEQP